VFINPSIFTFVSLLVNVNTDDNKDSSQQTPQYHMLFMPYNSYFCDIYVRLELLLVLYYMQYNNGVFYITHIALVVPLFSDLFKVPIFGLGTATVRKEEGIRLCLRRNGE
jgi:hypothetical protein